MAEEGTDRPPAGRYHFGIFEVDAATGELRRQGLRVKLNAQPFQVLLMLLERPGKLLTREEISRQLWPDGTFVDYDHGVNSAINRIREALGDTTANPRFIETLARRGYRFVVPVERVDSGPIAAGPNGAGADSSVDDMPGGTATLAPDQPPAPVVAADNTTTEPELNVLSRILATPQELPKTSYRVVQTLFVLFQLMYLGFYVGALANLAEIDDLLAPLPRASFIFYLLIITAAILIPVRAFLLCAVLFRAPGIRRKMLQLWPLLLIFDVLWALSPFLLLHHINFGLALACTTLLVYSPFAQRSLVLMGAGGKGERQGIGSRE